MIITYVQAGNALSSVHRGSDGILRRGGSVYPREFHLHTSRADGPAWVRRRYHQLLDWFAATYDLQQIIVFGYAPYNARVSVAVNNAWMLMSVAGVGPKSDAVVTFDADTMMRAFDLAVPDDPRIAPVPA